MDSTPRRKHALDSARKMTTIVTSTTQAAASAPTKLRFDAKCHICTESGCCPLLVLIAIAISVGSPPIWAATANSAAATAQTDDGKTNPKNDAAEDAPTAAAASRACLGTAPKASASRAVALGTFNTTSANV